MNRTASYTAASTFPAKLLKNRVLDWANRIPPKHVQINPTNVCNLHCSFCSCEERDKKMAMDYFELQKMMEMFRDRGCKAVTITGGGEPLLYPRINDLIRHLRYLRIQVGLVTNGTCLDKLDEDAGNKLTWARISLSDEREVPFPVIVRAVELMPRVDWAFSYVLSAKPFIGQMAKAVDFANESGFTHIRIVSDMLSLENIPDMKEIRTLLELHGIDVSKVIFQGRKHPTKGQPKCWISLLKPLVDAKGDVYPCCGTQYALDPPDLDYGESMKMGHWTDFPALYANQVPFDGSRCVKCYYSDYNRALELIAAPIEHEEFV